MLRVVDEYLKQEDLLEEETPHLTKEEIDYNKHLVEQDPNGIYFTSDFEEIEIFESCKTANDFVDWGSLHGEVVVYSIDELDK